MKNNKVMPMLFSVIICISGCSASAKNNTPSQSIEQFLSSEQQADATITEANTTNAVVTTEEKEQLISKPFPMRDLKWGMSAEQIIIIEDGNKYDQTVEDVINEMFGYKYKNIILTFDKVLIDGFGAKMILKCTNGGLFEDGLSSITYEFEKECYDEIYRKVIEVYGENSIDKSSGCGTVLDSTDKLDVMLYNNNNNTTVINIYRNTIIKNSEEYSNNEYNYYENNSELSFGSNYQDPIGNLWWHAKTYNVTAELGDPDSIGSNNGQTFYTYLDVNFGSYTTDVTFVFAGDGLEAIEYVTPSGFDWNYDMRSRFGEPDETDNVFMPSYNIWIIKNQMNIYADSNRITYSHYDF